MNQEKIKELALRIAQEIQIEFGYRAPVSLVAYSKEFASRLLDELSTQEVQFQKDAEPVGVVTHKGCAVHWFCDLEEGTKLYTHPQPKAAVPEGLRKLPMSGTPGSSEDAFAKGWNYCIDELRRLSAAPSLPAAEDVLNNLLLKAKKAAELANARLDDCTVEYIRKPLIKAIKIINATMSQDSRGGVSND